jgi:hypothetical protein
MKFDSRPVHAAVTGHCLEYLEVGDIHALHLDEIDKALITVVTGPLCIATQVVRHRTPKPDRVPAR